MKRSAVVGLVAALAALVSCSSSVTKPQAEAVEVGGPVSAETGVPATFVPATVSVSVSVDAATTFAPPVLPPSLQPPPVLSPSSVLNPPVSPTSAVDPGPVNTLRPPPTSADPSYAPVPTVMAGVAPPVGPPHPFDPTLVITPDLVAAGLAIAATSTAAPKPPRPQPNDVAISFSEYDTRCAMPCTTRIDLHRDSSFIGTITVDDGAKPKSIVPLIEPGRRPGAIDSSHVTEIVSLMAQTSLGQMKALPVDTPRHCLTSDVNGQSIPGFDLEIHFFFADGDFMMSTCDFGIGSPHPLRAAALRAWLAVKTSLNPALPQPPSF